MKPDPQLNRTTPRIMLYGHDSVGVGHLNRMMTIAESVRAEYPGSNILMATGTPYVPLFELSTGIDYIKLPALAKHGEQTYAGKYLSTSGRRIHRCREAILLGATQSFEPDILIVDKAPLGVCGELREALHWLHHNRPHTRLVFGMRDIEDAPETTIQQWRDLDAYRALDDWYNEIWVYGMQSVFDVSSEYCLAQATRNKLRFLGYVVRERCRHPHPSKPPLSILVTVGGGTDGAFVLDTYLAAAAGVAAEHGATSTLIAGPDMPRSLAETLQRRAESLPGTRWIRQVSCMSCHMQSADLVVAMGGYNTMCEALSNCKPVVVIPRTQPRVEQVLRAERFAQRAPVTIIRPADLTAKRLGAAVRERLGAPGATPVDLDFGGLSRLSERIHAMFGREVPHAAAVRL